MSKSLEWEEEAARLDDSFRKTLADIRPHVLSLTSAEDANLCGMWLDKLSCMATQRSLRNEYLFELSRQLRSGRVEGVFVEPPPNGALTALPRTHQMASGLSSSRSERSEDDGGEEEGGPRRRSTMRICAHKIAPLAVNDDEQSRADSLDRHDRHDRYAEQELRVELLERLKGEVSSLRAELEEMERAKESLVANQKVLVRRYKSGVADQMARLKAKQEETERENGALLAQVAELSEMLGRVRVKQDLAEKYEELRAQYEALLVEREKDLRMNRALIDSKDQEMSRLNEQMKWQLESSARKIRQLESKLESKLEEKLKDEGELQTMKEEFCKMRSEMDLVANKQSRSFLRKVGSLKRAICRLEKSREKLIGDYEKKISRIIQRKDLEIKALEVQLHGQREELCSSLSSEKQCEVAHLMENLEERYKGILAAASAAAEDQRQTHLKKIALLEEQLARLKRSLGGEGEGT